jgi:CRP-like cAMP-binding protein
MENINLLKKIPLFKGLKVTELMNVAMVAKNERHPAGKRIFRENTAGNALYVVRSGRVKVSKHDSFGEEHVLAYLGPGEYFGEISLVDNAPRSASVYADADTELLKIKRTDFRNLIAGNKEIERKFYKSFSEVLCERLRVTSDNLTFSQEINKMIQDMDNADK